MASQEGTSHNPIRQENGRLRIGPAQIVHSGIGCTNRVIHAIDAVLSN